MNDIYKSGIYKIENAVNGKCYVGSTLSFNKRWREHRTLLGKRQHHSIKLQRAWNKYGNESFAFSVLEYVLDAEHLVPREQYWIDTLGAFRGGYNNAPIAGSMLGYTHTEEAKKRMSLAQKGISKGPKSEEHKAALSAAVTAANAKLKELGLPHPNAGIPKSEETKAKFRKPRKEGTGAILRESQIRLNEERRAAGIPHPMKGSKRTPEQIALAVENKRKNKEARLAAGEIVVDGNKGKKRTPEQVENIRQAQIRKNEERRAQGLPHPLKGVPKSEETKAKSSATKTGKKQTPEHIEAMKIAVRQYWKDRKEKGIPHHNSRRISISENA